MDRRDRASSPGRRFPQFDRPSRSQSALQPHGTVTHRGAVRLSEAASGKVGSRGSRTGIKFLSPL